MDLQQIKMPIPWPSTGPAAFGEGKGVLLELGSTWHGLLHYSILLIA